MAVWTSLALLSVLTVSALSFPGPDESAYKIPKVGTNRRSQYYVLHGDGTYKYGYDTGEGAFESARLHHRGRQDGQFGYRDPEGNSVRLQYEAGSGGFQATGSHIPQPHPDFQTAHAAARARPAFVDPLADSRTDASYGFRFDEDGLARQEQSDADGNVRGSYSYTDEEGRTRTFNYVAGRDTGFVIQGDDLPEAPLAPGATPAATSLSSGAGASSAFRASSATSSFRPSSSTASSFRKTSSATSSFRPSTSHTRLSGATSSTQFTGSHGARTPAVSTAHSSAFRTSSASRPSSRPAHSRVASTRFTSTRQSTGPVEIANTRSQITPGGGHTFAYETSSHSRAETGDPSNNVDGSFNFVAEDDGQRREIQYEAGSDTGFIAEGDHIPVGPEVPGAPSGQPTGRIVPVQQVRFVDPLADTGTDASYSFGFESEQYSRTETADADGNVQGTYTVVEDDGTRRTYRFRAGKGVGYETEEVSSSRGPAPSRAAAQAGATSTFSSAVATSSRAPKAASHIWSGPHFTAAHKGASHSTAAHRAASQSTAAHRAASHSTAAHRGASHSTAAHTAASHSARGSGSTFSTRGSSFSSGRRTPVSSSFSSASTREVFPGFKLRQYGADDDSDKYGYVLTFDK